MNSTRICKAEEGACFKIVAIENFNRLNDVDLITIAKFFICCLPHDRIHVDWIDCFTFRVFIKNTADSSKHMVHRFAEVLPAMCCNEDKLSIITNPVKFWVIVVLLHRMLHRIDYSVTRHIYIFSFTPFIEKILAC